MKLFTNSIKSTVVLALFISLNSLLANCNQDQGEVPFEATLSGRASDAVSNDPLEGVYVQLKQGSEVVGTGESDASGNFSIKIDVLGEENFTLEASVTGYIDFSVSTSLLAEDQTNTINIQMHPKAKIKGQVTHEENNVALNDVNVSISDGESITTDAFGIYEFDGLDAGTYEISFSKSGFDGRESTIEVDAGEEKINDVTLTPLAAILEVDKLSLDFGTTETVLPIELSNSGGDTVEWSIVENIAWANANPLSGEITTNPSTLSISVTREGFDPGDYAQTLTISSNAGTKTISLTMRIQGAILQIIPSELSFGTNSTEKSLAITRVGQGTLQYDIQSDKSWLTVIPSSGSVSNGTSFVTVTVDRTGLGFDNYQGRLAFNTDNGSQIVNVSMTVTDPNAPQLTIEPLSLNLGQDVATRLVAVQNTGKGVINWTVSKSSSWLSISESEGQVLEAQIQNISIAVDRSSLTPGKYSDELRFTSSEGGNVNVSVEIEVANKPVLSVNVNELDFGREQVAGSFMISNIGNGSMTWSASTSQEWININPSSGTNAGTINVTVSRDGLADGNYSGQIDIESDGGVASVQILMKVFPPNEPPIANFTLSREIADLNQEINLDASGSMDDFDLSSQLQVRWRYTIAGSFTEWSSVKQSSISYSTQGIKDITLEVRDLDGAIGSVTKEVTIVENQAPNAVFSANPNRGKVGVTTFLVNATGSNDDKDDFSDLQFRWRWEAGQSFTTWSKEKTNSHVYGSVGVKTITLEVLDTDGAIGATDLEVELTQDLTEMEPNDVFTSANDLPIETELTGSVGFGEDGTDWFKVTPDHNGRIRFTIQNTGTAELSDLDQGAIYDSEITFLAGVSNGSSSNPRITPGQTLSSDWITVAGGETYFLRMRPNETNNASSYLLFINYEEITQQDIGEPNNSNDQALELSLDVSNNAIVGFGNDNVDWYQVTPASNGTVSLTIENFQNSNVNGDLDQGIIYNGDLVYLTAANNGSSSNPRIPNGEIRTSAKVTVAGGTSYFIRVAPNDALDASNYRILVNFEPIEQEDFGEPNDATDNATLLTVGESNNAIVGFANDAIDWYQIVPSSNGLLSLTVQNLQGSTVNGELDQAIIYDDELSFLSSATNGSSSNPRIPNGITYTSGKVTVSAGESYFIRVAPNDGLDGTFYRLQTALKPIVQADLGEPNNSSSEAYPIAFGESVMAISGFGNDGFDWYKVVPNVNGSIKLTVENMQGTTVNGDLDQAIIYNSGLVFLGAATNGSSSNPRIPNGATYSSTNVTVTAGETYFIRIAPNDALDAANYRLEVNQE